MRDILPKSALAGLVAAALMFWLQRDALERDAALARALRARGERVSLRVIAQRPRKWRCHLDLAGTTAAGTAFTAGDVHPSACNTAPPVGAALTRVVLPDDPTRLLPPEVLAARGPDGTLPEDRGAPRALALTSGVFVTLLTAGVMAGQRRRRASRR